MNRVVYLAIASALAAVALFAAAYDMAHDLGAAQAAQVVKHDPSYQLTSHIPGNANR